MYSVKRGVFYLTLLIVIISMTAPEVEGRRLVLRGRRTITRHYYTGSLFPAWVVIVLLALGEIVLGAILYFVLRKMVLSTAEEPANTYQPALMEDAA